MVLQCVEGIISGILFFYCKHCKAKKVKKLPKKCTRGVMHIAHAVFLAGHLGRKKTTSRVLSIFY